MSTLVEYVGNVAETVTTIFEGMAITFSHFVRRPMTIQYPDRIEKPVQEMLPLRYRGILEVDMDIRSDLRGDGHHLFPFGAPSDDDPVSGQDRKTCSRDAASEISGDSGSGHGYQI